MFRTCETNTEASYNFVLFVLPQEIFKVGSCEDLLKFKPFQPSLMTEIDAFFGRRIPPVPDGEAFINCDRGDGYTWLTNYVTLFC